MPSQDLVPGDDDRPLSPRRRSGAGTGPCADIQCKSAVRPGLSLVNCRVSPPGTRQTSSVAFEISMPMVNDVVPFDTVILRPGKDGVRGELGAVVGNDHVRPAATSDQIGQITCRPTIGDRCVWDRSQGTRASRHRRCSARESAVRRRTDRARSSAVIAHPPSPHPDCARFATARQCARRRTQQQHHTPPNRRRGAFASAPPRLTTFGRIASRRFSRWQRHWRMFFASVISSVAQRVTIAQLPTSLATVQTAVTVAFLL